MTIVHTRAPLRAATTASRAPGRASPHDGFVARVARKTGFARTWLRPYPKYSLADLEAVCDSARAAGRRCSEMILHSSELMPGCSPYRKDEAAVDALHRDVGALLTRLSARGCAARRCSTSAVASRRRERPDGERSRLE